MADDWHVYPLDDVIEHERTGGGCACIPRVEAVQTESGDAWIYTHHSLDGRELTERD